MVFFFFKQKTAYELRISDWSSDVCSSDLAAMQLFARQGVDATTIDEIVDLAGVAKGTFYNYFTDRAEIARAVASDIRHELNAAVEELNRGIDDPAEIGRASCRERVCQYV